MSATCHSPATYQIIDATAYSSCGLFYICAMQKILVGCLLACMVFNVNAQQKWSLQQCVQYAMDHNVSIKQTDIQARVAEITLKQNKLSQIPSLNFSNSDGLQIRKIAEPLNRNFRKPKFLFSRLESSVECSGI